MVAEVAALVSLLAGWSSSRGVGLAVRGPNWSQNVFVALAEGQIFSMLLLLPLLARRIAGAAAGSGLQSGLAGFASWLVRAAACPAGCLCVYLLVGRQTDRPTLPIAPVCLLACVLACVSIWAPLAVCASVCAPGSVC